MTNTNVTTTAARSTVPILVWTSAKSAVLHSCGHGWRKIEVDTASWTPEERALLASRVIEKEGARYAMGTSSAPEGYDVAPPTAESLRAHVADEIAKRKATLDASIQEAQAELKKLRDMPIADLGRKLWNSGDNFYIGNANGLDMILGRETNGHCTPGDIGRHEEVDAWRRDEKLRLEQEDDAKLQGEIAGLRSMGIAEFVAKISDSGSVRVSEVYRDVTGTMERAGFASESLYSYYIPASAIGRQGEVERYREDLRLAETERAAALESTLESLDPSVLPRHRDGLLPERELEVVLANLITPAVDGLEKVPLPTKRGLGLDLKKVDGVRWILGGTPDGMTAAAHAALVTVRNKAEGIRLHGGEPVTVDYALATEWVYAPDDDEADVDGEVEREHRVAVVLSAQVCGVDIKVTRLLPR
jgi:hypothetical protein